LSSLGGNQRKEFDDAIKLASGTAGNADKVAVIDGALWFRCGSHEFINIEHSNVCALSALLLKDFLKSF